MASALEKPSPYSDESCLIRPLRENALSSRYDSALSRAFFWPAVSPGCSGAGAGGGASAAGAESAEPVVVVSQELAPIDMNAMSAKTAITTIAFFIGGASFCHVLGQERGIAPPLWSPSSRPSGTQSPGCSRFFFD